LIVNANSTAGIISGSGTTTVGAGATLQASSFTQSGIAMQLGGTAPSANSKLNVTGALTESGTLNVSLVNNFKPLAGNSFDLFDSGSLSGAFSLLQLPTLNGRIVWDSSHLYDTGTLGGTLSVAATYYAGDINRDSLINVADISALMMALADLSKYRTDNSLTDPTLFKDVADVNGDGFVNNLDIQSLISIVAGNATDGASPGSVVGGDSSITAVPEPTTIVLMGLGALGIAFRRRSR
jgi:hypothetical protein